jgi:hypothetical protein
MYQEGDSVYTYHVAHFGHPSEYGYKDICKNWVIDRWKPDDLMDLYVEMGAHFFMAMGVHHDNFDCWDSAYQPWNSVRVGPKVDIVGTWEKSARARACVSASVFTAPVEPGASSRPSATPAIHKGEKGVPTTLQTILDGKRNGGRNGSVDLYGPAHSIPSVAFTFRKSVRGAWMMPSPSTTPI